MRLATLLKYWPMFFSNIFSPSSFLLSFRQQICYSKFYDPQTKSVNRKQKGKMSFFGHLSLQIQAPREMENMQGISKIGSLLGNLEEELPPKITQRFPKCGENRLWERSQNMDANMAHPLLLSLIHSSVRWEGGITKAADRSVDSQIKNTLEEKWLWGVSGR